VKTVLKDLVARGAARLLPAGVMRDKRYFELWQERGYHVTPVHFYEPIPDTRTLRDALWVSRPSAPGVRLDAEGQAQLFESLGAEFLAEWPPPGSFDPDNGSFEAVDAFVAYGLLRRHRPRRVVEIGSGWSSLLIAAALARNGGGNHTIVDPYPSPLVERGPEIVREQVQTVAGERFDELAENDVLFVDSSHVVAAGSDVQRIVLDVLPRVRAGVLVHFHDIFIPDEYPRAWAERDRWFWNEQYVLQAFLAFNDAFDVLWASHYMYATRPDVVGLLPGSGDGGSLWLRRR
jgi:hypothetical protein